MLFLVSSVFAADVVITPNPAYDNNTLTCSFMGNTVGAYKFEWSNGRTNIAIGSSLAASLTNVGDSLICTVYSFGPGGSAYLGEASVTILANPVTPPTNRAPNVQILLPQSGSRFTVGSTINFVGSATDPDGDSLTTNWNFDDGNTVSNSLRTTHTFTTPGTYTIVLNANDGQLSAQNSVSIIVMENYYRISNLQTYNNRFIQLSDNFYRGNPLYTKFNVLNDSGNGVAGLNVQAYIYNVNTGSRLDLTAYNGSVRTSRVGRIVVLNGEPVGNNPDGSYYFSLSNLPLDASLLGESNVLVVAFDNQNRAGQAEKIVYILNNPLQFSALNDLILEAGSSVSLDLNSYVTDRETPDNRILFSVAGGNRIHVSIDPVTHVATFRSDVYNVAEQFTFTANDRDGSVVSRTMRVSVTPGGDYNTPDRQARFAYLHGVPHNFEFEKVAPLVYHQTYKAGSNVRMIVEVANKGSVDEDLEIQAFIPGMQSYQYLGNLHINAGENIFMDKTVNLPSKLASGVYAMQLIASSQDNVQKTKYWTFVVTH